MKNWKLLDKEVLYLIKYEIYRKKFIRIYDIKT